MGSLARQLRRRPARLAFKQHLVKVGMKSEATLPLPALDIEARRLQNTARIGRAHKPYRKGESDG